MELNKQHAYIHTLIVPEVVTDELSLLILVFFLLEPPPFFNNHITKQNTHHTIFNINSSTASHASHASHTYIYI